MTGAELVRRMKHHAVQTKQLASALDVTRQTVWTFTSGRAPISGAIAALVRLWLPLPDEGPPLGRPPAIARGSGQGCRGK